MCSANIVREIESDEGKAVDNRIQGTRFGGCVKTQNRLLEAVSKPGKFSVEVSC
jgi:hypothetical protein